MRQDIEKYIAVVVVGLLFVAFAAMVPLPSVLAISGVTWRIIIGLIGCFLVVTGAYKISGKK